MWGKKKKKWLKMLECQENWNFYYIYPPTKRSGKHVQTGEQGPPIFPKISLKWQKYSFMFPLLLGHDKYFISATVTATDALIFTLGTGIFNTFMFRLLVSLKKSLCCCLIFTLDTWAFNTCMLILLVSLKLVLSCCLKFTLLTWIFVLFVSFKIALQCCPVFTLVTRIS